VRGQELHQHRAKQPASERAEHGQRDTAAVMTLAQARALHPLVERLECALDERQKACPERREAEASAPREQRAAELRFERLDARAHRWLSDIERARRTAEAALAHDALKGEELVGVHRGSR